MESLLLYQLIVLSIFFVAMCDKTVVFDKHGDIQVQLRMHSQLDTTIYVACSRALARASPVLRSQLRQNSDSNSAEQQSLLRDSTIEVDGNDHDSLTIFLNIAHAHYLAVPRTLSIGQLYNLAVLTSCYNCTSLLAPWASSWISGIQGAVRKCEIVMMLRLFWELNLGKDFCTMARRMVVELDASEFANGGPLWGNTVTTGIIGTVFSPLPRVFESDA